MRSRIIWAMLASGVVLIGIGMMQFSLTALQEPGPLETRIANQAKHFTIRRASSHGIPPRPVDTKSSREAGATHYGLDCTICHGVDGHAQTTPGRWMYPRATDLASREVQRYSDQELFWIIKNGIRFTGMPAFGKVEPADNTHQVIIRQARTLARRASQLGDDGTNDLVVSEVLRTNELQTWFLSEHLVNVPLVKAERPVGDTGTA